MNGALLKYAEQELDLSHLSENPDYPKGSFKSRATSVNGLNAATGLSMLPLAGAGRYLLHAHAKASAESSIPDALTHYLQYEYAPRKRGIELAQFPSAAKAGKHGGFAYNAFARQLLLQDAFKAEGGAALDIAHEIGHSINHDILHRKFPRIGKGLTVLSGAGPLAAQLGSAIGTLYVGSTMGRGDARDAAYNKVSGVAALATAPRLLDEVLANTNGFKVANKAAKHLGLAERFGWRNSRRLGPLASYGIVSAAVAGLPQVMKYLQNTYGERGV